MMRPTPPAHVGPGDYPPAAVTVDVVALTIEEGELKVLLLRRGEEPYQGWHALPDEFVHPDEDLPESATRTLAEVTGQAHATGHLEQLRSYGRPERDPRMRVVSVAYLALTPAHPQHSHDSNAHRGTWIPVADALRSVLAFDHSTILHDGLERARAKLEYTSLATSFLPPEFTIADLRRVYEIVWGQHLDSGNFHRKLTSTPGVLVETGRTRTEGRGRPAAIYGRGPVVTLNPPIMRPETAPPRPSGSHAWPRSEPQGTV